jgi:hypothetical protein
LKAFLPLFVSTSSLALSDGRLAARCFRDAVLDYS